jgi:YVTN family beta-propeller protein
MLNRRNTVLVSWLVLAATLIVAIVEASWRSTASAQSTPILTGPSSSSPIAITPDGKFVWVVNPDKNSVSVINVENDANQKVAEIPVLEGPSNLAISPDGKWVYVTDTVSGHVTFIDNTTSPPNVFANIGVGTEPYGLALTPTGRRLYVTNARSNSISVLDTANFRVLFTIDDVGREPRGIAITNSGSGNDDGELIYVTQFLATDRPRVLIGADNYKEGRVTVLSAADNHVVTEVVLNPIAETGFLANGDALNHIPANPNPAVFTVPTGAFPNMLNSIAIKGSHAYVPNNAASPNGPVRFNVNIQPLLSVIDLTTNQEGQADGRSQTINMNRGINFEPPGRVFLSVPWAIAFKHNANEGYVVASSSNLVVKVSLDSNETPTINAPLSASDPGSVVRIPVGQNPRGIAVNAGDTRAYVMNEVSRDVSVIDLTTNQVMATVPSSDLPASGTQEATVLLGKAVFNSSTGINLPQLGSLGTVPTRLSSEGWSSCFGCHPFGLTDGVVWIFASGPRRTLPLNGTFAPGDPTDIKILNHSGIFDEVQDFELNIRNVSGGMGLITMTDGTTPDPNVTAFNPPNTGRSPHLDALAQYIALGIHTPKSPLTDADPASPLGQEIAYGRSLFDQAACATCHGGPGWSSGRHDGLALPPPAAEISNTELIRFLKKVGTFDAAAKNEIRATGAAPLGADGFVPPSLLGDFALGPYLHNGSALTFDNVLENVAHRSAGTAGTDTLTDARDRAALVTFLKSIDSSTVPFAIR